MTSLAMMPWFPRDFIAATLGWSLVERGLYVCLLFASWELGDLPADEDELARIAGATSAEFGKAWPRVKPKFEANGSGRLVNRRLESHRAKSLRIRDIRAQAGRAGGIASGAGREASVKQRTKQNAAISSSNGRSKTASNRPSKDEAPSPSPDLKTPLPPQVVGDGADAQNPRANGTNPRAVAEAAAEKVRWEPVLERARACGFRPPHDADSFETYETSLRLYERDHPPGAGS